MFVMLIPGHFLISEIILLLSYCRLLLPSCYRNHIYYMQNEEIWRFLNKLKAIITSGLGRFISSKEIFLPSRFYFSNAIVLSYAWEYLSHVDVSFWRHVIMTSTVCKQRSECKTLDSEEPLKWRSHEQNNLMRSKCLCSTLTFLDV